MSQDAVEITTPEHVTLRFQTAGLGSRFAAQILDSLIMYGIIILLVAAFGIAYAFQPDSMDYIDYMGGAAIAIIIIITFLIMFGYYICFEYFWHGQTPGKRALGLKTIQEQGQPLTFLSAVIRNFLRIIDILPGGYLVGCLFIFFHPKHQRIGDLVAGTIVVYQNPGVSKKELQKKALLLNELQRTAPLELNPLARSNFTIDDWQLLAVYMRKKNLLPYWEKKNITETIARKLLPKAGYNPDGKSPADFEQNLAALYLALREEWEHI